MGARSLLLPMIINFYFLLFLSFSNLFSLYDKGYLVRDVELVNQVKVQEHPQDAFQSQTVIDDRVVELVTEEEKCISIKCKKQPFFRNWGVLFLIWHCSIKRYYSWGIYFHSLTV